MQLENWDDLKFVLAMLRHQTMSAAARFLDTNVATVSRRIDRLSQELGVSLFEKRGQSLFPTAAAERLAIVAETMDQMLRAEVSSLLEPDTDIKVTLEVSAPPSVHAHYIFPRLSDLAREHPNIRLKLTDKVFAQGLGEADIQIRIGRPDGGRLKARKFRDYSLQVFHRKDHELNGEWIGLSHRYPDADMLRTVYPDAEPEPRYRVEEVTVVRDMIALTGLPGMLPDFLVSDEDTIVCADIADNNLPSELWITYHETRQNDPNLRAVVNWICGTSAAT